MNRKLLEKMSSNDVYNFLLFGLSMIKNDPNYCTLAEMIYILDKNTLLKLLEYYGGQTITIPTIDEMEELLCALNIYQQVSFEGSDFDTELTKVPNYVSKKNITELYKKLEIVLQNYRFKR